MAKKVLPKDMSSYFHSEEHHFKLATNPVFRNEICQRLVACNSEQEKSRLEWLELFPEFTLFIDLKDFAHKHGIIIVETLFRRSTCRYECYEETLIRELVKVYGIRAREITERFVLQFFRGKSLKETRDYNSVMPKITNRLCQSGLLTIQPKKRKLPESLPVSPPKKQHVEESPIEQVDSEPIPIDSLEPIHLDENELQIIDEWWGMSLENPMFDFLCPSDE